MPCPAPVAATVTATTPSPSTARGPDGRRARLASLTGAALLLLVTGGTVAACGGSDVELPPLATEGRSIARSSGCAACHGSNGTGGVGPSWVGRFGSTVELESGEQVLADEAYLRRAISEPAAEKVAGYSVIMPDNNLTDDEITAVVAYIEALQ